MEITRVAVIGACGKMGRGISLLLLQEMAFQAFGKDPSGFHLALIDSNTSGYYGLKNYLKEQLLRYAEKNINRLRSLCEDQKELTSNAEVIEAFLGTALSVMDCSASLEECKGAKFIFEAVFEQIPLKCSVLKRVHEMAPDAFVFTNTSSIPIEELASESGLEEKLIGFHFYNPPAVQKLLEIIPSRKTSKELEKIALDLGKQLGKTIVQSKDVPGFIGNGYFAAEIAYICQLAESLKMPIEEAVNRIDAITERLLLRPMGIFQLLDYVGLPTVKQILSIMKIEVPLIKKLPIPLRVREKMPLSWKEIQQHPELLEKLPEHFKALFALDTEDARLAQQILRHSKQIVDDLVAKKVARSAEDVATVLKNGFFHLYAPGDIDAWI